jgi:hypothetical protein
VPEYEITVERDGRFLLIHIPALGGVTQARFPGEVESMAGDYIALVTETPVEDVAVRVVGTVPTLSTAEYETVCGELAEEIEELRDRLRIYERDT